MNLPIEDDELLNLLSLRAACKAGFVCLTKNEWDEMAEFESLFLLRVEAEENRKNQEEYEIQGNVRRRTLISGSC